MLQKPRQKTRYMHAEVIPVQILSYQQYFQTVHLQHQHQWLTPPPICKSGKL
jgi:hypothetical protein